MELDLLSLLGQLYSAATGGQWAMFAALAVIVLVFVLRKYVAPKVPALASDAAGVLLAFAAAFGASWLKSPAFSGAVLLGAAKVAFSAMGGFVALKKLLAPIALWAFEKLKSLFKKQEG